MNDLDFLIECGIDPDAEWLISLNDLTKEQKRYVKDLVRINRMLGNIQQGEDLK